MIGMNRFTGKRLGGQTHLAQSVGDILSTLIGLRTMVRDYGSALMDQVDQPANPRGRARLYGAVAVAIARWEPRLKLTRVGVAFGADGKTVIDIEGHDLEAPLPNSLVRLSIPLNPFPA